MRIIHIVHGKVNPNGANGISRVVYYMNLFQKKVAHQSEIWAFVDGIKKHETLVRDENVTVELFPRLRYWSFDHEMIKKFKKERESIDIVHFHMIWFFDKNILARFLNKLKISFVATTHGTYSVPSSSQGKKKIAKYLIERKFLNRATEVHALTPEEKTGLVAYGVKRPIFVVPNGLDLNQIPPDLNTGYFNNRTFCDKIKITWVGVLRKDKNIDKLIRAVKYLPSELKNQIQFVIIGPNYKNSKEKFEDLITQLQLGDIFHFEGPLYGIDKYNALNSSDLYIMPSSSEGVSLSILDAMALGKPCILTRGCNMTYYYNRGFYEMCECIPDEIAKAIEKIVDRRDKWSQMSDAGKNLVSEIFNWESVVENLINNYERIIRTTK